MSLSRWRRPFQRLFALASQPAPVKRRARFTPRLECLEERCIPTVAYAISAGTNGNQSSGSALGMDFNVTQPITINSFGVFDDASNGVGLTTPITARLYNRATQTQVGPAIVFPAGTPGTLIGGSRFLPLPAPITLAAGFQGTMVAEGYGMGAPVEQNGNLGSGALNNPNGTNDGGGLISFVGTGRFGPAGSFPMTIDGGPANRYAAGTFDYQGAGPRQTLSTVFGTGVDNSGNLLPDGAIDSHYRITVAPPPIVVPFNAPVANPAVSPIPPWLLNGPLSRWIAERADANNGNAIGNFNYETTFDLTGFDPTSVLLKGQYGADNSLISVTLNGALVAGITVPGGFTTFTPFTINSGFVAGLNTLDFLMNNAGGPGGFRVDLNGSANLTPDLSITKTAAASSVQAGTSTNFTITVTNNGRGTVPGATITDNLPAGISSAAWSLTGSSGGASVTGPGSGTGNISTTATLPAGSTLTFLLTATISSSFSGALSNTATVTPPAGFVDPNPNNNSSTATITVSAGRSPIIVVGTDIGALPEVRVYDVRTQRLKFDFFAYPFFFTGGVRVAAGDVNGDGVPDIITAPGPGWFPEVKVFDGRNGALIRDFFAFNPFYFGGLFVAGGDLNGDGVDDIVVGPDAGALPEVKGFSGRNGTLLVDFFAYSPFFTGGVRVGAGDVDGDGKADVITGPGPGMLPDVRVFSQGIMVQDYFIFPPTSFNGIYVAANYTSPLGLASVIAGSGAGDSPQVRELQNTYFPYPFGYSGGVRVGAVADLTGNGVAEVLTAGGIIPPPAGLQQDPGITAIPSFTGPVAAQVIEGLSLTTLDAFFAFAPYYFGGLFIAGSR